ncbi:ABC transporter permease/substrate-binding protein [Lactovum odontotermitis]
MNNLISTWQTHQPQFWQALLEHIQISLISLFLAILVAVPLALLLRRFAKVAELVLQVTGIFQTIPSLALLGLLIPIVGIGSVPAVIALVVYAVFPILQTTYTGLQQIDPSLTEAATAFGMNRRERLMKYELALAMPFIMAGIRTATVMIIGTATLAALIGAGGLGNFILLGINQNDVSLILIGAISSAVLAVIFSFVLRRLEKARIRTILISFFIGLLLLLGSFYRPGTEQRTITIGGKLGSEPTILINMYEELIEADSNIEVNLKANFGDTTFCYNALKSDKIDLYPEYSGTILTTFLKKNPTSSTRPSTVWRAARDEISKQENLTYLSPMKFQDTYALAVKSDFAQKNHLENISDLAKVQSGIKAGFDLEFANRTDGYKGLQSLYGLDFTVSTMQTSLIYNALNSDAVNLAQIYSTDSQIRQYKLSILKDDRQLFPPYQAAPLVKPALLKKYPELRKILNKLSGKITDAQMIQMNYEVNVKQKSPASVARAFLKSENLLD